MTEEQLHKANAISDELKTVNHFIEKMLHNKLKSGVSTYTIIAKVYNKRSDTAIEDSFGNAKIKEFLEQKSGELAKEFLQFLQAQKDVLEDEFKNL